MSRWRAPVQHGTPYITAAGYRALETELESIWKRRREVVRHLAAAAAEGDRSENAEYIYRKKELAEIDRRIRYLQRRLPVLTVVSEAPRDPATIYFGATVDLEDAEGVRGRFRIVGSDEIDATRGCISVDSPMAKALLKRTIDDEVTVTTDQRTRTFVVVGISYAGAIDP